MIPFVDAVYKNLLCIKWENLFLPFNLRRKRIKMDIYADLEENSLEHFIWITLYVIN